METSLYSYSIMRLNVPDDKILSVCEDIQQQYLLGISSCPLFSMTLTPEDNPPVDKAKIFCEQYKLFKDKLDKKSSAYINLSGVLNAPNETKGSILAVFSQKIKRFISKENLNKLCNKFNDEEVLKRDEAIECFEKLEFAEREIKVSS